MHVARSAPRSTRQTANVNGDDCLGCACAARLGMRQPLFALVLVCTAPAHRVHELPHKDIESLLEDVLRNRTY